MTLDEARQIKHGFLVTTESCPRVVEGRVFNWKEAWHGDLSAWLEDADGCRHQINLLEGQNVGRWFFTDRAAAIARAIERTEELIVSSVKRTTELGRWLGTLILQSPAAQSEYVFPAAAELPASGQARTIPVLVEGAVCL